jgi:predicted alpha-1,2-mannosidase
MQVANMGNYAHGNQPAQHMIYLYNWAGQPWKAQYWAREVMNRLYNASPNGYCGDEDNGQTSAWYVFSALGFYPVCPASDEYALGAPLFKKAVVHLENGNEILINAPENSADARYIEKMKFNGSTWENNYLQHSLLTKGARIDIKMSQVENKSRGTKEENRPYSFSRE